MMRKLWILSLSCLTIYMSCNKNDDESIDDIHEIPSEAIIQDEVELVLNPSGNAPLAALATFKTLVPTTVTITVNGQLLKAYDMSDTLHQLPVLGLLAGQENEVVFTIKQEGNQFARDTFSVETGTLPDYLPNVHVKTKNINKMEPGLTLCELSYGKNGSMVARPFMFDANGHIRWYLELEEINNFINPVKRLNNGNWVFGLDRYIYEYDMLGYEINRWELEGYGQHHDIIEKPDGNLILAATKKDLQTIEDHIIEMDRSSGAIVHIWDLRAIMDNDRFDLVWNSRDWLHVNSLWYDESDGSLLISARHQAIFKITKNNDLEWILAPRIGWGNAGVDGTGKALDGYLFEAVNSDGQSYVEAVQQGQERAVDFDWPWGQHDASILPNGHILAFDNGFNRHFRTGDDTLYSRGVEYKIDVVNGQVQQVWEYGALLEGNFYSRNLGSADYLPTTNNRLLCSGNIHTLAAKKAKIIELSYPDSDVVFDVDINFANIYSTGVDAWGQTDMVYRCSRLSLYP